MTKEINNNKPVDDEIEEAQNKPAEVPQGTKGDSIKVTSDTDISFTDLNWGISAGAEVELPADKEAQDIILSNHHIKVIK